MRGIWILLFPFALAACDATSQGASFNYADAWNPHGRPRSDAALQVDTRACDAKSRGGANDDSPKFKACMRAHGWKFSAVEAAASDGDSDPGYVAPPDISAPDNSIQAGIDMANQQAAMDASMAAAEQQNEAAMAAAQQTMNNANSQ